MAKKSSQDIADERAAARTVAGSSEDGARLIEATDGKPVRCDNPVGPQPTIEEPLPSFVHQKPRKPMPRTDPELQAMARIDRILAELDGNQQRRVVEWIRDRFGPQCRFGPFEGGTPNDHDTVKESIR